MKTWETESVSGIERLSSGLLAVSIEHSVLARKRNRVVVVDGPTYRVEYMNDRQAEESLVDGMSGALSRLRFVETTR